MAVKREASGTFRQPPIPNPGLSYWQRTTRAFPLLNANEDASVPKTSGYVILGSGLAGALAAFELLANGVEAKDVVILEAREAVSGATSRNAGHVRPDPFRGFTAHSRIHGPEQAVKIISNERLVLDLVDKFVKKHAVPCDFHLTTTFDVCLTNEFAAYESDALKAFGAAGGDSSHVCFFVGKEARKRTGIRTAISAYEWPAASIHPSKLVQWLLNHVVSKGVQLFTHCPVERIQQSVQRGDQSRHRWDVMTPRGIITSPTIIHCTNAYAGLLLPGLAQFLTPKYAQAQSVVPLSSLSGNKALQNTYRVWYSLLHVYSLIQRQDDGTIILGGSLRNPLIYQRTLGETTGVDDRSFNAEVISDRLEQLKLNFDQDFASHEVNGEGIDHAWTGIIGTTTDAVPFVGPIPGLQGQFICAGFNGFGMTSIFTCARGIARLSLGGTWKDTELPECYEMSEDRISRLTRMVDSALYKNRL